MCTQVRCRSCGKPTWAGCGRHIEAALANVPRDERCRCRETSGETSEASETPKKKGLFGLF
jgi:hypothetical protein